MLDLQSGMPTEHTLDREKYYSSHWPTVKRSLPIRTEDASCGATRRGPGGELPLSWIALNPVGANQTGQRDPENGLFLGEGWMQRYT